MITRRTKIQLVIFVIITLVGVSFVGAKYARLDRLVHDTSYTVTAHFTDSGGAFTNAEVSYRGVRVGTVSDMQLTPGSKGVDLTLSIDNKWNQIPADTKAVVGDRSAVGEQYVDLEPMTDSGPYLNGDSQISDTEVPIQTDKLLTDISDTVSSVDRTSLRTTVVELGKAFAGTGKDLQTIIDSGSDFIKAANANFDVTTRLIDDGNTVLNTQLATQSSLRTFSTQLKRFSDTLASSDPDLRKVIDSGSFAANQLRGLIEDNRVDLGQLIGELVTTGKVVVKRLPGIQQVLVLYPYIVEASYTVISKSPQTGLYDAHFGMIISDTNPCTKGYNTKQRSPNDGSNAPMNTNARCTESIAQGNSRGAQNAPDNRPATHFDPSSVVGSYDPDTGKFAWGDQTAPDLSAPDTVAPKSFGQESWKWLYAQPLTSR